MLANRNVTPKCKIQVGIEETKKNHENQPTERIPERVYLLLLIMITIMMLRMMIRRAQPPTPTPIISLSVRICDPAGKVRIQNSA